MRKLIKKKGQEEMLGFALIMIIVAVILVIFLGFSLRKSPKEAVESYEVESFIQSMLSYSTDCGNYRNSHLPVRDLVFECNSENTCLNGEESCKILESTLKDILEATWNVGEDTPIKGYKLDVVEEKGDEEGAEGIIPTISKGNETSNARGSMQPYSKGGTLIEIYFTGYY